MKYLVYVPFIVFGENEQDALEYVDEAITESNILDCDGITGILPVDIDEVELADDIDFEDLT